MHGSDIHYLVLYDAHHASRTTRKSTGRPSPAPACMPVCFRRIQHFCQRAELQADVPCVHHLDPRRDLWPRRARPVARERLEREEHHIVCRGRAGAVREPRRLGVLLEVALDLLQGRQWRDEGDTCSSLTKAECLARAGSVSFELRRPQTMLNTGRTKKGAWSGTSVRIRFITMCGMSDPSA
jgi:hypothetical protein